MRSAGLILILALLTSPARAAETVDLARFTREVETLRGHRFERAVEHRVLPRSELKTFLADQIERELPVSIDTYMATLEALHLVDGEASVDAMLELYDAQVLAFYDPVGHIYYSLDELPKDVFLPPLMIDAIVVHELVHALQDQRFDAGSRSIELQSNWDAALAYQALLEGEALLVMIAHLGRSMGISLDDLIEQDEMISAIRESAAAAENVPDGVPLYFVESLKFPYVDGLTFVVEMYRAGGWAAIDAVHRNPPWSSEELMHPEVYLERVASGAKRVEQQRSLPSDELVETVLGEFHWAFLLGREAGEGWASDIVSVRHGESGVIVLVDSSWDTQADAIEFELAYRAFLGREEAPNRAVTRSGSRVRAAFGADARASGVFVGRARAANGTGEP